MQDHLEQHLDKLAKKVVKSSAKESPSLDFTANVMAQIEAANISHITVYKPLISKRTWFIIATLAVIGFGYLLYSGNSEGLGLLDKVDFSVLSNNKVAEVLSGIKFSKTFMYVVGLGGLMFFIQILLMKHYLNKRLEY